MSGENRKQDLVQNLAARIERMELDLAVPGVDFERGARRGDVPARVPAGVLVTGRQIRAAEGVELPQQVFQALFVADLGDSAGDSDSARGGIPQFTHDAP